MITCTVNNKKYIGATSSTLKQRWCGHKSSAKKGTTKINRAIREHGANKFIIEQIEIAASKEILSNRERFWIQHYDTLENGFNSNRGGAVGGVLSNTPWIERQRQKITKELREKMQQNPPTRLAHMYGGDIQRKNAHRRLKEGTHNFLTTSQEKVICPKCKLVGQKAAMKRWHFDKCKY